MSDKENTGAHQPARRQLLKTLGALGGAFAVGSGCPMAAHAANPVSSPGTLPPDGRLESQPLYGDHQAGILTPQPGRHDAGSV